MVFTKTPEPTWQIVKKTGNIEIRSYDPMIVAETQVSGERYAAINDGFRILAGYIFGGNKGSKKIAMTAPVIQQAGPQDGEKIAMTAPVIQMPSDQKNVWTVRFVMPPGSTRANLPEPNDTRVKLIDIPAYQVAAIRFNGMNTDKNLAHREHELRMWLDSQSIKPVGPATYAFYNPPWTLPFMRRNEVMLTIDR